MRLFFWLLLASVLLLGVAELLNALRRPSLARLTGPAGANSIVLYQKGRAANREAWLFTEPAGDAGQPVCFQHIDCTARDGNTGDLRWTFDGGALYAGQRRTTGIEAIEHPLWVYEFATRELSSVPASPLPNHPGGRRAKESALVDIINRHGGKGPIAVAWYDLGKRGTYLFAWQITRWENALPASPQP